MTREEIIQMALEAGFATCNWQEMERFAALAAVAVEIERFAALVAAAEREAICRLADDMLRGVDAIPLIESIRERGKNV